MGSTASALRPARWGRHREGAEPANMSADCQSESPPPCTPGQRCVLHGPPRAFLAKSSPPGAFSLSLLLPEPPGPHWPREEAAKTPQPSPPWAQAPLLRAPQPRSEPRVVVGTRCGRCSFPDPPPPTWQAPEGRGRGREGGCRVPVAWRGCVCPGRDPREHLCPPPSPALWEPLPPPPPRAGKRALSSPGIPQPVWRPPCQ